MTSRLLFVLAASLGMTGCVAAVPLVTQSLSGADTAARLCAVAKLPGQTTTLCDQARMAAATPAATKQGGEIAAR
jgi:hypothetical protein